MRQEKPLKSAKINPLSVKAQTRVKNTKGVLPIVTGIKAGQPCPPNCILEIPLTLKDNKKD